MRPHNRRTNLATLALSVAEIVIERIEPQLADVGIAIEIGGGIEMARGIPELSRSDCQIMHRRIDPGRLDVRIRHAIPLGIEERRTRHEFRWIENIRPCDQRTDLTTLALSIAEIVIERIQPQLPHVGVAIEVGGGIEVA